MKEYWGYRLRDGALVVLIAYYDYELCVLRAILDPNVKRIFIKTFAPSHDEAQKYFNLLEEKAND
jgi:hypothetical protein